MANNWQVVHQFHRRQGKLWTITTGWKPLAGVTMAIDLIESQAQVLVGYSPVHASVRNLAFLVCPFLCARKRQEKQISRIWLLQELPGAKCQDFANFARTASIYSEVKKTLAVISEHCSKNFQCSLSSVFGINRGGPSWFQSPGGGAWQRGGYLRSSLHCSDDESLCSRLGYGLEGSNPKKMNFNEKYT